MPEESAVVRSTSRPGNRYYNAEMESFWSILNRELMPRCQFTTPAQTGTAGYEWIEVVDNPELRQHTLGYQSPVDFETNLN